MRKLAGAEYIHIKPKKEKPAAHESAVRHVTGSARYVDDIPVPHDTRYAAVGLSTVSNASLLDIQLSEVKKCSGVVDAITAEDIPGKLDVAPVFDGDPLLAHEQIKFNGQPLFAVLADSHLRAQEAVRKAVIKFQAHTPCVTIHDAEAEQQFVRPSHQMQTGEPLKAIHDSTHQLKGTVTVGGQEHFYLEGQVALAIPDEQDRMLIYTSSQHPSEVQKLVAEVLGVKLHHVTVDMRRMGGGFGGKETQAAQWACLAAVLARRNQCPVKLRLPRWQDMLATGKRHPFFNQYQVGFDQRGVIQGCDITVSGNCGHSADLSDAIVDRAMFHADNAYYLGEAKVTGHRYQTNLVSNTAFRGFGGPQGMLAAEAMIDSIARHLNADPLTIRKRNLYGKQPRNSTHYGMTVEHNFLPEIIQQLERDCDYWQRREQICDFNQRHPFTKKGLALTPVKFGISFTAKHLNQAGALVHVYTDGSIQVNHGGTEMGQGLHTKIAHIAACEFGVDLSHIEVTSTRTDKVPNTSPTAASSGTDLNGKAVENACQIIVRRLKDFLAQHMNIDKRDIRLVDNQVITPGNVLSFAELVQSAYMNRISLSASGFYRTPKLHYDRVTGKGRPFFYFAFGAACSEVVIDTLTGEYKVTRVDILHDVGKSLNPAIDIGQIEGGFVQGMGWLTCEDLVWNDSGQLLSNNPATYKIPAIGDIPSQFNVSLFNRPNPEDSIYHSKAVGEPPLMLAISVWCALKDALASTVDYKLSPKLIAPATPENVLTAFEQLQRDRKKL